MHRKYRLLFKYRRLQQHVDWYKDYKAKYTLMNTNALFLVFVSYIFLMLLLSCFSHTSFAEIAMQKFFKPWLLYDFIFRRSSYAENYEKSLNKLQSFAMQVSSFYLYLLKTTSFEEKKFTVVENSEKRLQQNKAALNIVHFFYCVYSR